MHAPRTGKMSVNNLNFEHMQGGVHLAEPEDEVSQYLRELLHVGIN